MSSEVKPFRADLCVHPIMVVPASDYAALEAENTRMKREVSHWQGLAVANRKVADDALAEHQRITSAMTAEVERLIDNVIFLGNELARIKEDRDALCAELAALKEQEPIAVKTHGAWDGLDLLESMPDGTKLYLISENQP